MVSKRRGLWSEPTAGNAKTTAVGYNTRQLEVHRTLSNRSLIRSSPTLLFVQMEIELPSTLSKQIPSPWSAELPLLQTRDVLAVDSSLLLVDWDIQVEVVKEVVAAYQGEFRYIIIHLL
ncbi:uncharacterized protein LOC120293765 [Eucalyptus grandis]|uniref:uncharacterized protein LOC120293765 n=1 Tax=Eucalyptus grandis TaxID=71139 RepID=UPI00192E8EF7|nr:uncharacterized protein LOC120293765 [Eucalyptus grandis]